MNAKTAGQRWRIGPDFPYEENDPVSNVHSPDRQTTHI